MGNIEELGQRAGSEPQLRRVSREADGVGRTYVDAKVGITIYLLVVAVDGIGKGRVKDSNRAGVGHWWRSADAETERGDGPKERRSASLASVVQSPMLTRCLDRSRLCPGLSYPRSISKVKLYVVPPVAVPPCSSPLSQGSASPPASSLSGATAPPTPNSGVPPMMLSTTSSPAMFCFVEVFRIMYAL